MFSCAESTRSKRQRSTEVACSEKIAKFTPFPSQVAPNGYGYPSHIFTGVISEGVLSATSFGLATDATAFRGRARLNKRIVRTSETSRMGMRRPDNRWPTAADSSRDAAAPACCRRTVAADILSTPPSLRAARALVAY